MALKSPLGFGMMRLPIKNNDPTNFDYEQLNPMVDAFLDAGYTYFDTSFVYHNGKSEEATRKAVVERHPRDSFTVATKFPTFILEKEEQIETIFAQQLQNLGVDYIDYYLLHLINTVNYEGVDGKGGIVKTAHLFEHAKQWLADGMSMGSAAAFMITVFRSTPRQSSWIGSWASIRKWNSCRSR